MLTFTSGEALELCVRFNVPFLLLVTTLVFLQNGNTYIYAWLLRPSMFSGILYYFYFSAYNLYPHGLTNTLPSYLLGFLNVWVLVISAGNILCHVPGRDFHKVDICLSESNGHPLYKIKKYPFVGRPWYQLLWAWEFLASPRGIGWNYGTCNVFRTAKGELYDPEYLISGKESYGVRAHEMRASFLRKHLWIAALDYIMVDICTHLMYHDSFLSGSFSENPFTLPVFDCLVWFLLLPYRLIVAGVGIYSVIDLASKVFALVSVGILGERWLGSWGQYWNYPPVFGSFRSIWDKGLAGLWGEFWHQMFRFGLTTVAATIIPMPLTSTASSTSTSLRRLLRLLIVFTLSGLMHAGGSWTLASGMPSPLLIRTYPHLTLVAFILQAPGIAIQRFLFRNFSPAPGDETAFKLKMLLFTIFWSLCTMPLIVADFAAGQIFKIPFLPLSIINLVLQTIR